VTYAHLAAGVASKSVKLQRPARANVCSHSVKDATASVESILYKYPSPKLVKIARLMDATDRAHSNSRTPRRSSRGASSLRCLPPKELLRKHAASHLLVSVDLCAENRCPVMDSFWKCPVEGRFGSAFHVKG